MAKYIPPLSDPKKVIELTEEMQRAENLRAQDRSLIDALANGRRPYTLEEAEKYQIHVNVNWLEMTNDIMDAITQVNNALIFKGRFFNARCTKGPIEKRDEWGMTFTTEIHKCLKNGRKGKRHMHVLKSRNACVVLHGKGVLMWMKGFEWLPRFIPLEDLLIPTDTYCDFSNLNFFAVNLYYTVGEFMDLTHGERVDKGWNIKAVNKILDDLVKPTPTESGELFTMVEQPEKRIEQLKQNRALYDADTTKTVKLRMVFYLNPENGKWHRVAVLRLPTAHVPDSNEWIYDGRETPFADHLDEFLHVLYGDNNMVPPLKYHSVRGLGMMLYGPAECNNRLRCEFIQHTLFNLKTLFQIENPIDQDRPKVMDLSQYSVLEKGWRAIPANERHQIDPRLVEFAMSQMRQIMSENAANYVQDIDRGGTKQPLTAAETLARVQGVNVKVSGMLASMYEQEKYYFEEIVRRFLNPKSGDSDVKDFQKRLQAHGIPRQYLVPDAWEVEPERVLGGGDQFLATQEANALLTQSARFDPSGQRIILRNWTSTMTRNPGLAELLVPDKPRGASEGVLAAEDVFGTLMQGIPASIREGIERSDYVEALLGMLKKKIQDVEQTESVPPFETILGMQTVLQHVKKNLQILAQDRSQLQLVKELGDLLAQMERVVTMFAERFAEQMQSQQPDPETDAKVQGMILQAQTKAQIAAQNAAQRLQQKQAQFELQMQQAIQKHQVEMQRLIAESNIDIATETARARQGIQLDKEKGDAQIEMVKKQAKAREQVTAQNGG